MNIKEVIIREMRKKHMPNAELSRRLKRNNSTIAAMFNRETLQVNRLIEISNILEYNFFQDIADTLSFPKPVVNEVPVVTVVNDPSPLQQRIKELEIENAILRKLLKI